MLSKLKRVADHTKRNGAGFEFFRRPRSLSKRDVTTHFKMSSRVCHQIPQRICQNEERLTPCYDDWHALDKFRRLRNRLVLVL